jgi:putative ABC transport system permease protein
MHYDMNNHKGAQRKTRRNTKGKTDMIYLNLILAFRNLIKNRVYSFLIIGGFAIGFAACILIGLFYHTETTVNNDFENHKQIYRLYDVKKNRCNLNWDLYPLLSSGYAAIEDACPLDYQNGEHLTIKNELTHKNAEFSHLLATTNNFFSIFSVEIVESLSSKPFDGKESVSISAPLAKLLFGTQNPLGQQVNISNYFFGTVTSVFNELPVNSTFRAEVIINSENEKARLSTTTINGKRYNPTNHFIKLKAGITTSFLADELNKSASLSSLDIDSLALQSLDAIYLSDLTIKSRHARGNPGLLKIFLSIAVLILLLSSINYLNYSVSMQYTKLRETGIKKTFGAGFRDIVNYAIVEVTLGITIAFFLALIITDIALTYSENLFGKALHIEWNDWLAVGPLFLIVIFLVILLNSLAPIYIVSKFNISEFLSGFKGKRNNKQIWKQTLLTFQLSVSIALIAIVIIIYKQLIYVRHSDPGFNRELLLRLDIPYNYQQTEALRQELRKLSFVKNTTFSSGCPGMINHKMDSNTGQKSFDINCIYVGDNYLNTMEIELLEGRSFLNGDLNKACLINEEAFKQYGWEGIEGQKFNNGQDGGYEVLGIIKDFKFESSHFFVEPLALLLSETVGWNVLTVRITPGNTGEQIEQIMKIWNSVSPYEPFSFIFYDDFFQAMYEKEEKLASSITFFSLIAIALTCMGILGQIYMICLTRVKEIGVRKINGARVTEVLFLLNRDLIKWLVIAFVLATPVSWYIMHKWLENFAYKTSLNWWVFALAGIITLLIILVTVNWQSWRAATRNPVEALRYE